MGKKRTTRRSNLAEDVNRVHDHAFTSRPSPVTSIADGPLKELARHAMVGLNASSVAIAIDVDGEMTCRARAGATAPEIGTPVQRDKGITGECLQSGTVVRCDHAHDDPRVDRVLCEQLRIGSILVAPLLRNGEVMGVVEAFFVLPHSFDEVDVEFLQSVANRIVAQVWGEELLTETQATPQSHSPIVTRNEEFISPTSVPEAAGSSVEPSFKEARDVVAEHPTYFFGTAADETSESTSSLRVVAIAMVVVALMIAAAFVYVRRSTTTATSNAPQTSKEPAPPTPDMETTHPDPFEKLQRAAEAGDPSAQYNLAHAYKDGSGVKADPQQANAWLLTAAEHGNTRAQLEWARTNEASAPVDAYTWYVIAGQNGIKESDEPIRRLTPKLTPTQIGQVRLEVAHQYLSGHALKHDPIAAYVWFRLAEWGGNASAGREMKNVESQLSSRQRREADARASAWIRRHTAPPPRNENAAAALQH